MTRCLFRRELSPRGVWVYLFVRIALIAPNETCAYVPYIHPFLLEMIKP